MHICIWPLMQCKAGILFTSRASKRVWIRACVCIQSCIFYEIPLVLGETVSELKYVRIEIEPHRCCCCCPRRPRHRSYASNIVISHGYVNNCLLVWRRIISTHRISWTLILEWNVYIVVRPGKYFSYNRWIIVLVEISCYVNRRWIPYAFYIQ